MAKKKALSKSAIIEKAATVMQRYVRLKAADIDGYVRCVTCDTIKPWNDGMQGGHFIPRACLATKLMEDNIHPQCSYCNGHLRGNMIKYTLYMEDMYGRDFVEHLESLRHTTTHYTKAEAYQLLEDAKEKMKELESQ